MHYADDATIVIKQNQCFKEVIKEISDYEQASGAKVNLRKTKGLWLGKWKHRTDAPLGFTWTNDCVRTLGVYFGNDNPGEKTFAEIIPTIKRSMNYWKQFSLCKFSKARVIEIFHASRLWYTSTFYPIPNSVRMELQGSFKEYINFPRHKRPTVSEDEMKKLRLQGGIKLIDIQTRVETSRAIWLINLLQNTDLKTNLAVATALVGTQKGALRLKDLAFTNTYYCTRLLAISNSTFYTEALRATARLTLNKRIDDLSDENIFYNPIFTDAHNKPLAVTKRCERLGFFKYHQFADEYSKMALQLPFIAFVAKTFERIAHMHISGRAQNTIFITSQQACISFGTVTFKNVYEELLSKQNIEHHSVSKWENKFSENIDWDKVWATTNNPVTTEVVKTTVWEQIHLNDYCTYSYNKWHKSQDPCPLCLKIPEGRFHLTLECTVTQNLWNDLEPHLRRLSPTGISEKEMVFGIAGHKPGIILRNWITFLLRHCIVEQESIAFHNKLGLFNEQEIKLKFNERVKTEVMAKYRIYSNLGRVDFFERIFACHDYLLTWEHNWYQILTLYKL